MRCIECYNAVYNEADKSWECGLPADADLERCPNLSPEQD